jgi:hypothetical protein
MNGNNTVMNLLKNIKLCVYVIRFISNWYAASKDANSFLEYKFVSSCHLKLVIQEHIWLQKLYVVKL